MYHNFLRDQRGAAALEFIIISVCVLVPLLFAVVEVGDVTQRQTALQSAVRAGGEYARYFPTDSNGIQNTVTNALPSGWSLSGTPTVACYCTPTRTATSCSAIATGTTCAAPFLIQISASMPASFITTPWWSQSFSNSVSYEVRIK
ncbi:TadE/TadG family type IV pilus assembly protein [Bradyrhizobium sp. PMVTL-01]|uniref:TadE/TadG family type IV pilus assembly protein n=1 Tax=Bradyrhizobium sp. PMVTL-01 TaxID=3434999 RepID=UPI003F6EC2C4